MLASLLAIPIIVLAAYGAWDLATDCDGCWDRPAETELWQRPHER